MYDRISGVKPIPVGEGTHLRIPWLQSPNVMDIRTRPRTISSVTGTKGMSSPLCGASYIISPFSKSCARSNTSDNPAYSLQLTAYSCSPVAWLQICRWSTSPSEC